MRGNRIAALHQYASALHKKQGVLTYYLGGGLPHPVTCAYRATDRVPSHRPRTPPA
jgi:hypothetical protein